MGPQSQWGPIGGPICSLCIVCVVLLPSRQQMENHCGSNHQEDRKPRDPQRIDYLGIGAFTVMITNFFAAIEFLGRGKSGATMTSIFIGVAVSFGFTFLLVEAYQAEEAVISLNIVKTLFGIHFLVQVLLLLGRQSVFPRPAP
jgi:hypothetical protein